jgi:hypothetical protein
MELLIAGVVSAIVQITKRYMKTNRAGSIFTLVIVAFIGGIGMTYLKHTGLWEAFVRIAVESAGIYALLIRNFTK